MLRTTIALVMTAALGMALTAERAEAWGGFRAGRTTAGFGGFSHSSFGAVGGAYGGAYHAGTTGYRPSTGFYHAGTTGVQGAYGGGAYHSSAYHAYSPSSYGTSYGGGVRYGSTSGGAHSSGVYRYGY
ncbi:MAG: hypothetical protein L0Z62_09110 [Gemmataceae bacterium]|nr:hypothetical protein [Gemmataceae bacterium]